LIFQVLVFSLNGRQSSIKRSKFLVIVLRLRLKLVKGFFGPFGQAVDH